MSKVLSANDKRSESSLLNHTGYSNCWEYYADALKKLDMLIQFRMNRTHVLPSDNPLDQFRGLLVTEDEVISLLQNNNEIAELETIWHEENQQLLSFEALIQRRLMLTTYEVQIPLIQALLRFNLSPQEEQCIFLCLAVELDRKYEKIYGYLQDDITCKYPTVDLILNLLCRNTVEKLQIRQLFAPHSKLNRYFFKTDDDSSNKGSFLTKTLKLDEQMVGYLLNPSPLIVSSSAFYYIHQPTEILDDFLVGQDIHNKLISFAASRLDSISTIHNQLSFNLWGNPGMGKKLQVKHFCQHLNKSLIVVNLQTLREKTQEFSAALTHIFREATLYDSVLAFEHYEILLEEDEAARRVLAKIDLEMKDFKGIVFLLSSKPWKPSGLNRHQAFISIELILPEDEERIRLWSHYSAVYSFEEIIEWGSMSSKFKFSPGQIKQTFLTADLYAKWRQPDDPRITPEELHKACYAQVQHKLENKATHIKPKRLWDEVILPTEQKELLRNACNQVKFRNVVYGEWGFEKKLSYGKGVSILFAGPPGTGKTMSAEVVAKELMLEIYKVDLSQVISKYIGETEKNLQEIFHEAQFSNAILFFDEADALFGKRSEVKDSHDKYANIETAYLLQKIEEYAGITILATNFSQNIDDAFMRRLNYVIKFPFPDAEHREKIWRSMFPVEAPLDEDIDYKFIAQKFEIAGGNIKNIVVSAAFLAAESHQSIGMKHIIQAARHELKKSGKLLLKEDLGEYDTM